MSIQANINQGISLMSLLISQSPAAEKRRVEKSVEADAPRRAAQLELAQREADIKVAEAEQKKQINIALDREAAEKEKADKLAYLTITHGEHAKLVGEIARGKKGAISRNEASRGLYEEHLKTREAAIKSGRELFALAPTEELRHNLGVWETEIGEIETAKAELAAADKEKAKQEREAAKLEKTKKTEEAEKKAKESQELEQRRFDFSRQIMEGVYTTDPAFDPRRMNYGNK